MNIEQLLNAYFNTENVQIDLNQFSLDLFLTALLAFLMGLIYVHFGRSLSNRKNFASNFILLALTTMFIITVVKSSLALSLGLVGALSIVRFRSAIKEPEELTYLFLAIALGLGFGAEQRYVTIFAFTFIALILVFKGIFTKRSVYKGNLYIKLKSPTELDLNELTGLLLKSSTNSSFKRLDEKADANEYLFSANFSSTKDLTEFKNKIRESYKDVELTFFEEKDIFN